LDILVALLQACSTRSSRSSCCRDRGLCCPRRRFKCV